LINILYLPTRYFPSISGAEFYIQRIAEILSTKYNYNAEVFTSDAIDFKALRDPKGKKINSNDKFFDKVNSIEINRYPIKFDVPEWKIIQYLESLESFNSLNIPSECVRKIIQNGPFLNNMLKDIINREELHYDLIHTTFYPYFNLIISLIIGKHFDLPTVCTPFFHFSNPRYSDMVQAEILKKFDILIACTNMEKEYLIKNGGGGNPLSISGKGYTFRASSVMKQRY